MMNVNCQKLLNAFLFFFSCHKQIHISERTILLNILFLFSLVKMHWGKEKEKNNPLPPRPEIHTYFKVLKLKQYLEEP